MVRWSDWRTLCVLGGAVSSRLHLTGHVIFSSNRTR